MILDEGSLSLINDTVLIQHKDGKTSNLIKGLVVGEHNKNCNIGGHNFIRPHTIKLKKPRIIYNIGTSTQQSFNYVEIYNILKNQKHPLNRLLADIFIATSKTFPLEPTKMYTNLCYEGKRLLQINNKSIFKLFGNNPVVWPDSIFSTVFNITRLYTTTKKEYLSFRNINKGIGSFNKDGNNALDEEIINV